MNNLTLEQKKERLKEIIKTMEIPGMRVSDIRWLSRNIGMRNYNHPDYAEAAVLVKEILLSDNQKL